MIGLIGGLGVGAGIHYYRELARAHEARARPLALAMVHADIARVMEHVTAGDRLGLARYLAELLQKLAAAGATLGVIPAVQPHICIDQLLPLSPLPLVNLLDVITADVVDRRRLRRVGLFGTRFVVESQLFGRLPAGMVVTPRPEEITTIHDTYVHLARTGHATPEAHERLTSLAQTLCAREQLDAILLAGTDLTLLFDPTNTPFPHVDCARLHIDAVMDSLE